MAPNHTWDNLRQILTLVAGEKKQPLVKEVRFHYEVLDQRDGTGNVHATSVTTTGATIEVEMI